MISCKISPGATACASQEPVLFASSIRHNIMQGFPDASKEDFNKAGFSAGFFDNDAPMESFSLFFLGKDIHPSVVPHSNAH